MQNIFPIFIILNIYYIAIYKLKYIFLYFPLQIMPVIMRNDFRPCDDLLDSWPQLNIIIHFLAIYTSTLLLRILCHAWSQQVKVSASHLPLLLLPLLALLSICANDAPGTVGCRGCWVRSSHSFIDSSTTATTITPTTITAIAVAACQSAKLTTAVSKLQQQQQQSWQH